MDGASAIAFEHPEEFFQHLAASTTSALMTAASDIALVLDAKGVILDFTLRHAGVFVQDRSSWVGKKWLETVTAESQHKVETLLSDANPNQPSKWRQINHPGMEQEDIPVSYTTIKTAENGNTIAIGRDLRPLSTLQQRLLDVQHSMERDFANMRHAEMRYRMLFQMSSEAIFILDAATRQIQEANPAVMQMLERSEKQLIGRVFPKALDDEFRSDIDQLLSDVRQSGQNSDILVRAKGSKRPLILSAALIRNERGSSFLIRLRPQPGHDGAKLSTESSQMLAIIEQSTDGFVITDADGRILSANQAFLNMCQLNTRQQAIGESLDRWLGRQGIDMNVLKNNLANHGSIRLFQSKLYSEFGSELDVELSAVSALDSSYPCLGFNIRHIVQKQRASGDSESPLLRPISELTQMVGKVSLKELVSETTEVMEKLCIETALKLTNDNRASTAEMLGLSRQSLYVKLRRYGLGDLEDSKNQ
ncbi:MAG: transcriptional regulator PpsR [Wenzhouxiangellaceae bacterium]